MHLKPLTNKPLHFFYISKYENTRREKKRKKCVKWPCKKCKIKRDLYRPEMTIHFH